MTQTVLLTNRKVKVTRAWVAVGTVAMISSYHATTGGLMHVKTVGQKTLLVSICVKRALTDVPQAHEKK